MFREEHAFGKGSLRWCAVLHSELLKNVECVLSLMHPKAGRVALELNSEVALNRTEVVGAEILMKVSLQLGEKPGVTTCEENVVHIYQQSNGVISKVSIVEFWI